MKQIDRSQIKALIRLLSQQQGDEASLLRDALALVLKQQPQALQEVIENEFHSEVPPALVRAMHEICWEELNATARHYAQTGELPLQEALGFVSRFVNPAFVTQDIERELDILTNELRPLLENCPSPQSILHAMGHFFFDTKSFVILPTSHDIKDISFGRFLQKKQGAALCLCALYAVCSERLGLDFNIVDMAGRVLVSFQPQDGKEPLFADPLDQARPLTLDDCKNYIFTRNLEWSDNFIVPLSPCTILRRFLAQMIFILNKLRDDKQLSYLRRYMDILKD